MLRMLCDVEFVCFGILAILFCVPCIQCIGLCFAHSRDSAVHIHSTKLIESPKVLGMGSSAAQKTEPGAGLFHAQVLKRTLQLGTVTGLVIGGAMAVGAGALPSVFSSDAQVVGMARSERFASALDACSCCVLLLLLLFVGRTRDA
jgi:hypothetical protein